jgi:hypothetical protein
VADGAHKELFVCPNSSCRETFGTFSALIQHVETKRDKCNEGIWDGTRAIWKLLRYLRHNITRNDEMIDAEKFLQAAQIVDE